MKLLTLAFVGAAAFASLTGSALAQAKDYITVQLKDGPVVIELLPDVAPKHVARIKELAEAGEYNNVAFHRVIPGFMAQTGDVQYGNMEKDFKADMAGMGGSSKPDVEAEFSQVPFERGTVGMARSQDPNSANSQFFIMFAPGSFLNGQYTVVGQVVEGMDNVDKIKKGDEANNGSVADPDRMISVKVGK
ncbi:peptidylprolyl isomerase [Pararhizobium gei]|uniref:peptidylprolyl isomerase n=1 Tax=Pararhizobium gei TaxID=1395951 RepID=UPI0023DA6231|nr:peptidylprolyl isomerase [Rhizobium gei]